MYPANVYQVLLSSPSDVYEERIAAHQSILAWNAAHSRTTSIILQPISYETNTSPEMGDHPQNIINRQICNDADLLVAIFWTRVGTPTEEYESGSIEEIERHIKAEKIAMLYFSKRPVELDSVDSVQYEGLKSFKESCRSRGLYNEFTDVNDFRTNFLIHLSHKLASNPYFKGPDVLKKSELISKPKHVFLSPEAIELLKEAVNDERGMILSWGTSSGEFVMTNKKHFIKDSDNPRETAAWRSALRELETERYVTPINMQRRTFQVSREGYELAKNLKQAQTKKYHQTI